MFRRGRGIRLLIAWHVATALFLFRWIFRDPKVDVRFLAVGALFPDVVDLVTATVAGRFTTGELYAHSLIVPAVYMAAVLILTRRGRNRRAWFALGVAWLFHLLIDGMWADERVFLWPFLGWEMPVGAGSFWPEAVERALADPLRWGLEVIGMVYLGYVWVGAGFGDREIRLRFLRDGRIPQ